MDRCPVSTFMVGVKFEPIRRSQGGSAVGAVISFDLGVGDRDRGVREGARDKRVGFGAPPDPSPWGPRPNEANSHVNCVLSLIYGDDFLVIARGSIGGAGLRARPTGPTAGSGREGA